MIQTSKAYRTKDGQKVRVYATDGVGHHPVHGAILTSKGWMPAQWDENGRAFKPHLESELDLVDESLYSDDHPGTIWIAKNGDSVQYVSGEGELDPDFDWVEYSRAN